MRPVEELHEVRVPDRLGVELNPHGLRMVRRPAAHGLVIGVRRRRLAAGVPDGGGDDAFPWGGFGREVLQEDVLRAPEAACAGAGRWRSAG